LFDRSFIKVDKDGFINGDVFIGDKINEVNITINKINSPSDLLQALKKSPLDSKEVKEILEQLLKDPEARKEIDDSIKSAFYKEAADYINKIIPEFISKGAKNIPLDRLEKLLGEARSKDDLIGICYIGNYLLHLIKNERDVDQKFVDLANEIINIKLENKTCLEARIKAHSFLAFQKYLTFSKRRIENHLSFEHIKDGSGQYSSEELKAIAGELMSLRFNYLNDIFTGIKLSTLIKRNEYFMFPICSYLFTCEQDAVFLKQTKAKVAYELVKKDTIQFYDYLLELADLDLLYSTASAELNNNKATFHLLDEDFERAKNHSAIARDKFLDLGHAHPAKIAHQTYMESVNEHKFEKSDEYELKGSHRDMVDYIKKNATRVLKMKGIDLDKYPSLKRDYERGIKNLDSSEVQKFCEHIIVGFDNFSQLAEEMTLITMGEAIVTCRKKKERCVDKEVERAFLKLRANSCLGCQFHSPRPNDWERTIQHDIEQFGKDHFPDA